MAGKDRTGSAPLRLEDMPRVGGIATMPSRLATLGRVIPVVLPQLDRLYVFLDGHDSVPDVARHEKITVFRSGRDGDLHSSGKFLGLTRERDAVVYVTFDDDIIYPPDYVNTLIAGLARFGGRVVAGFHGTLFTHPYRSFRDDQNICHFRTGLAHDIRVDVLGTGTTALVSSVLPIDPRTWPYTDLDDLMVALAAERREIPRVAIARPPRYLDAHAEQQSDSLWQRVQRDERRQVRMMGQLLAMERKSRLGLPPRG
jgi:hypothetical protein